MSSSILQRIHPHRVGFSGAKFQDSFPVRTRFNSILECLNVQDMVYPADADSHYRDIHKQLSKFTNLAPHPFYAGHDGPWIEDLFNTTFSVAVDHAFDSGFSLRSVFGDFIPIIFPFVRYELSGRGYHDLLQTFRSILRRDVLYVAVSQSDKGINMPVISDEFPNLLIMSAGGVGHVPIPLLAHPQERLKNLRPSSERKYLVNYVGSMEHAPADFRHRVKDVVEKQEQLSGIRSFGWGYVDHWQQQMGNSSASLCIRGFGRTSFHLAETIQLGLLPIHVYDDIPWIPYRKIFERDIGFVATLDALPSVLQKVADMSDSEVRFRESKISQFAQTHFKFESVLIHLGKFFLDPSISDFSCQNLSRFVWDETDSLLSAAELSSGYRLSCAAFFYLFAGFSVSWGLL